MIFATAKIYLLFRPKGELSFGDADYHSDEVGLYQNTVSITLIEHSGEYFHLSI